MTAATQPWIPPAEAAGDWRTKLITNHHGIARPLLANAITAIREAPEWAGVLAYNEFAARIEMKKPAPWGGAAGQQWTDQHDRLACDWLQHSGILVGVETAGHACQTVALERPFHPAREYIESLRWDQTGRIDGWLSLYVGADHSDYVSAVGARWLLQAVARILHPGVKADCILVLEGDQGIGKSTAARTLFDPWYCDHLPDLSSKDSFVQLCGMWAVELSELSTISRAEANRVKAFLSSATDRFRFPYGKRAVDIPRQTVFVGTINNDEYLRDETGNRRFWPIRCGKIELDTLERDRDQLWAEAVARFRAGSRWWLDTPDLSRQAEREQMERFETDAWSEPIETWLTGRADCSVEQILTYCIEKPRSQWTQSDKIRIARTLRGLGLERYRVRDGDSLQWRYRRKA